MNETPEAVRDRIKAEELAKGSDPRVAEGRAKAAEMRARHGLPIAPQEAWVAKLSQEGGTPTATAQPAAAAPAQAPSPEPESAPEPAPAAPPAQPEPAAEPAPAEPAATQAPSEATATAAAVPAQAPSTEPEPTAAPPVQPEPAAAAPSPPAEPVFEPEVGEIIEREDEVIFNVGGVKVRDARIATWILILLLAIPLWAMLYLLALGGANVGRATTGCIVEPDRSFTCFHPKHETGSGGGH